MSPAWSLVPGVALFVSGAAFLVHEPNEWLYSRSAFLHHAIGWMLVVVGTVPARHKRCGRVRSYGGRGSR